MMRENALKCFQVAGYDKMNIKKGVENNDKSKNLDLVDRSGVVVVFRLHSLKSYFIDSISNISF